MNANDSLGHLPAACASLGDRPQNLDELARLHLLMNVIINP